ncbi:MAG: hypothetical protein IRY92_00535 [Dactylosporangium sp.]|nr:hypothetical protein [Dactylosporangium sp.]
MSRQPRMHGQDDDAFLEWLQTHHSDTDGTETARPSPRQRPTEHQQALADGGDAFALRRLDDWT